MNRSTRVVLIAGLAGALVSLGLSGCSGDGPFTSTALNGVVIKLDMPLINAARPMLTVDVSVAGGPVVPLLLDTGSAGLRIFANEVGVDGLVASTEQTTATFEDGTTFNGVSAVAPVVVGGIATDGPIALELVKSTSCSVGKADCVGAAGLEELAKAQHFSGILGVGLAGGASFSPLIQLVGGPPTSFTIKAFPRAGAGTLTFNITPTEPIATYTMARAPEGDLPNGVPAWASNQTTACWAFGKAQPACVATSFDTGAPFLFATSAVPGAPPVGKVPDGTAISLYPPNGSAAPGGSAAGDGKPVWSSTVGDTPGKNQAFVQDTTAGGNAINSGIAIFRSLSLTFDISRGQVLLG